MEKRTGGLVGGIVALVIFFVIWSALASAFGDTFARIGNEFLKDLGVFLHYAMWITGGLAIVAIVVILVRLLLPALGDWFMDRAESRRLNAEARKLDLEASITTLSGFGGSEYLVKHQAGGGMIVYDPVENLINRIASGGIDHILAEVIGRIIHPARSSKIGRIETTYGSHPLLPDGLPVQQPRLLDEIAGLPNILIVGGKGSGKTTLLQWLEAARVRHGKVIVLDSHAHPAKWQGEVIGIGRNYRLIKNAMVGIVNLLNNRYRHYSAGQSHFEPVHTFVDEFTLLPRALKDSLDYNIQEYSLPVLTEGRKVAITALWGIHSDRAKILGFEGMADLKQSFDCIVYLKKVRDEFYALVDFGEGIDKEVKYQLPGPFIVQGQAETVTDDGVPILDMPQGDVWDFSQAEDPEPEPTEDEQKIIDAVNEAITENGKLVMSHVTEKLGWTATGPNYKRIRNVLEKWQIGH